MYAQAYRQSDGSIAVEVFVDGAFSPVKEFIVLHRKKDIEKLPQADKDDVYIEFRNEVPGTPARTRILAAVDAQYLHWTNVDEFNEWVTPLELANKLK